MQSEESENNKEINERPKFSKNVFFFGNLKINIDLLFKTFHTTYIVYGNYVNR